MAKDRSSTPPQPCLCTPRFVSPNHGIIAAVRAHFRRQPQRNTRINPITKPPPKPHPSETTDLPPNLKSPTFNLVIFLLFALFSMSFLTKLLRPFSTMSNAPAQPMTVPSGAQTATVAAGCFWGVEHMYRKEYKGKGLYDARVGYIGGDTENPGYRAVCSGRTGRTC